MRIILVLIIAAICCLGCKNDTSKQTPTESPQIQVNNKGPQYQQLPNDMMMDLWNKGDLIDYIFHNLPFSMNQTEQASIRTNLTYFSSDPQPTIPAGCKPMGRQFFGIQGNIVLEADIYFSDNCAFYVFFIDGKAKYANKMSESGQNFFSNMIQRGLEARNKQLG